jgi:hypothetical protein
MNSDENLKANPENSQNSSGLTSQRAEPGQYSRITTSDEHGEEFGQVVRVSIQTIEAAEFLPHSGIHFP